MKTSKLTNIPKMGALPPGERLAPLLDELTMAIRWERPYISLLVYRSELFKKNILLRINRSLRQNDQGLVHCRVNNVFFDIPILLRDHPGREKYVFSVSGLRWGGGRGYSNAYRALNMHREYFADAKIHSIIWLTPLEYKQLTRHAPDFWAVRDSMVEFMDLPAKREVRLPDGIDQDHRSVVESYATWLKMTPGNLTLLRAAARLYATLGCYEEAVAAYRKAARLNPQEMPLYLDLAEIYLSMGRPAAAARILKKIGAQKKNIKITARFDQLDRSIQTMKEIDARFTG